MKRIIKVIFSVLIFLLCSCGSNNTSQTVSRDEKIIVQLVESEHYQIMSDNPAIINRGDNADFKVKINEDRLFDLSNDGIFIENKSIFRVENVQYSKTVSFQTRPVGDCQLTIINDYSKGNYMITPNRTSFVKGETVAIKALSDNFMCYTLDDYYRNDNLNKGSKMPISFEKEYKFVIDDDVTLVLNYFVEGNLTMIYHANGGETIDKKDSFIIDYEINKYQVNPVTILGTYYLFRDGYTLESYNTEKDGTGTRVGIGSKVDASFINNNKIELFAQWKKWNDVSDFEYEIFEEEAIAITKYVGSSDIKEIVIPNSIDNKSVKKINEEAFKGINAESIVLNLDLKILSEKAIVECDNLLNLHMFTNIESIKNNSIKSNSLKKLFINSTIFVNNKADHDRDITNQIDQIRIMEKSRVIFVGQFTIRCNHDFSPFKEKYTDKDFYVFGAQAGCNFAIPLDILMNFLDEDDMVIISILETTMRQSYVGSGTFLFLKYNFDLFSLIDYQEYKNILFSSYEKFVSSTVRGLSDLVYNPEKFVSMDDYGCYEWGPSTDDESNVDPTYSPNFEKYQKIEEIQYFEKILNNSRIKKENRFITWSAYNGNSIEDYNIFDSFEKFIKDNIGEFNYFDTIRENIYPGHYFRKNDSIHLSSVGSSKRIERWLEQIPIN